MRGAPVQERRAAARRAGNEDRRRERARQDCPILALLVREDQKRRKQPLQVPARRETPECDSDASLWRLEVRAPSASIRRGSASSVASRRVALAAAGISAPGWSLFPSYSKSAPASRLAARANNARPSA